MTTALALFDLTDLASATVQDCAQCGNQPATTRVHAARQLLGVIPTYLAPTRYRDLAPVHSSPCCDTCAWNLANSVWSGWFACPTGTCFLWARTLADPRAGRDCKRHHDEVRVVWRTPVGVAS